MRRFERSNYCLAPIATAHAAEACFCRLHQTHEESLEYLSRHGPKLRGGHVGFKAGHTGVGGATGGEGCSKFSPGRLEGG
jgi:hypothetical protein